LEIEANAILNRFGISIPSGKVIRAVSEEDAAGTARGNDG
jgi:hypothetical protein